MCGVPHHALQLHRSLVRRGFRVAICEQTEAASKTKKLVRREVVRIVTRVHPSIRSCSKLANQVLAASLQRRRVFGAAFLDISKGEFLATQENRPGAWEESVAALESYAPRELLFPASLAPLVQGGLAAKSQTAPLRSTLGGCSGIDGRQQQLVKR